MTHNPPTPVSVESLQGLLSAWFAPWVQALDLRVESFADGEVALRLPQSDQLSRVGGMLCGQAMMSAADTAMVLTTVQLNTSFLKPLSGQDARITARVVRAGKNLVFGEIDITGATDGRSVCRASTTYALL